MIKNTENAELISFSPTKEFFINTITKDVDLDAAILDLIDNSIDGYIISNLKDKRDIKIEFNEKSFCIEDNCGGIKKDKVRKEVFRLGAIKKEKKETLGVYGIGLKRAMFKIGKDMKIESDDGTDYFSIHIDESWIDNDNLWELDFETESKSKGKPFFRLEIKKLYPEIAEELSLLPFQERLIDKIRRFHSIHIEKRVNIIVNKIKVEPFIFSFLKDENFSPLHEKMKVGDDVEVEIIAGFSKEKDIHGWCVFCNDRMILKNNTSHRTGFRYGLGYHPTQDSEFLGMVFFKSSDPGKLPWKSTKDDVVTENRVYRVTQVRMEEITKELIRGLTQKLYHAKDSEGETIKKSIYEGVPSTKWTEIPIGQKVKYPKLTVTPELREPTKYTTVTYHVLKTKMKNVKNYMGNPSMTNKRVGEKTFKYYCNLEGIKDE